MAQVVIYTTRVCPYCIRAKQLLEHKEIPFEEVSLENNPDLRQEVMKKSGQRTVPQIFINDESIGGFDDLKAMDSSGKLDELLKK